MSLEAQEREAHRIAVAYANRIGRPNEAYSKSIRAERERHYTICLDRAPIAIDQIELLEVGCGSGSELERCFLLGVDPANCAGVELLENRFQLARKRLPAACDIRLGDACKTDFATESFDVVFASTVFTSILDDDVQASLAGEMWRLVKPGGAVLWYDFVYNNPRNPDVRGVPRSRVLELFPQATAEFHRVTLAPPIGRRLNRLGATGYRIFNSIPFLRTHLVGWLEKRGTAD